ncbi:MAG: Ca2+-binding EF-hand superfamily protein, partial [Saprospiraceae bacterium]
DYPMLCGEGEDEYLELDGRSKRKITVEKRKDQQFESEVSVDKVLKIADLNHDGKVELPELYNAIELFFDGNKDISLPELRKLIDHFFDQY